MPSGIFGTASNLFFGKQQKAASSVPPATTAFATSTPGFEFGSDINSSRRRVTFLAPTGPTQSAFAQRFPRILGDLDTLRERTAPGFSAFRTAGLDRLRSARQAATSNLSQSLAKRNVLGSSFGQDALSRARAEFGQKEAEFEAETALSEIQTTAALVQQENQIITQNLLRELQEFGLASGLPVQVEQLMNQNAEIRVGAILGDEKVSVARNALTNTIAGDIAEGVGFSMIPSGGGK